MEFFDKKQDVIDLQLTDYGKQLLSRGLFKPAYYAFSDDEIIYDSRWVSGSNDDEQQSEQQSDIETRIQEETPRLKTQYRKVGAERSAPVFPNGMASAYANLMSILELIEANEALDAEKLFLELASNPYYVQMEKLLNNTLGNKSFQNSYDPAWNTLFYHGEISDSLPYYKKNDICFPKIPQLNCTLKDKVYRGKGDINFYEILSKPKEVTKGLNQKARILETGGESQPQNGNGVFFEKISGDPPAPNVRDQRIPTLFIEKDFLFISLEEANVDFDRDNFMIEVYEVETIELSDRHLGGTNDGEERLTKMFFQSESQIGYAGQQGSIGQLIKERSVEEVFYFEVDQEINSQLACYLIGKDKSLKKQSLYVDNVFNCEDIMEEGGISIDPYTSLPEVETGDVC